MDSKIQEDWLGRFYTTSKRSNVFVIGPILEISYFSESSDFGIWFFVIVAMPVTMSLTIKLKEVEKLIRSKRSNFFAIGPILVFFYFSESSDFGVLIFCDSSNDSDYVID